MYPNLDSVSANSMTLDSVSANYMTLDSVSANYIMTLDSVGTDHRFSKEHR